VSICPADAADLPGRWRAALGVDGPDVDRAGRDLLARYAEPHRRYHTQQHLAEVLTALDLIALDLIALDVAGGGSTARLAAWFHDAVYDPRWADNEERSAALASKVLPGLGLPPAVVEEIARLVRLTATHDADPHDAAGAALCDADLAILGADAARYAAYADAVRAEYCHLPADAFATGRADVLRGLLERRPLYRTEPAARRWAAAARANLDRELRTFRDCAG